MAQNTLCRNAAGWKRNFQYAIFVVEFAGPLVSKRGFDPQYASVFDRYAASTRNLLGMFRYNFNTKFGKDKKPIKIRPATQNTHRVEISIRNAMRRKHSGSGPLSKARLQPSRVYHFNRHVYQINSPEFEVGNGKNYQCPKNSFWFLSRSFRPETWHCSADIQGALSVNLPELQIQNTEEFEVGNGKNDLHSGKPSQRRESSSGWWGGGHFWHAITIAANSCITIRSARIRCKQDLGPLNPKQDCCFAIGSWEMWHLRDCWKKGTLQEGTVRFYLKFTWISSKSGISKPMVW